MSPERWQLFGFSTVCAIAGFIVGIVAGSTHRDGARAAAIAPAATSAPVPAPAAPRYELRDRPDGRVLIFDSASGSLLNCREFAKPDSVVCVRAWVP